MAMKNPPHVGRVIWHGIIEPLDLSVTKVAEILGVRRATLSDLINGKTALTAEMALRIHKAFGPDVGHLCGCRLPMMRRKSASAQRKSKSSATSPTRHEEIPGPYYSDCCAPTPDPHML